VQGDWGGVASDFDAGVGAAGERQQPPRGAKTTPARRELPRFNLIATTMFRGATRNLIKGLDPLPQPYRGFASAECAANRQLHLECGMGVCDNRTLQRRSFRQGMVLPVTIGGRPQ